jgi:hypothetical protein
LNPMSSDLHPGSAPDPIPALRHFHPGWGHHKHTTWNDHNHGHDFLSASRHAPFEENPLPITNPTATSYTVRLSHVRPTPGRQARVLDVDVIDGRIDVEAIDQISSTFPATPNSARRALTALVRDNAAEVTKSGIKAVNLARASRSVRVVFDYELAADEDPNVIRYNLANGKQGSGSFTGLTVRRISNLSVDNNDLPF